MACPSLPPIRLMGPTSQGAASRLRDTAWGRRRGSHKKKRAAHIQVGKSATAPYRREEASRSQDDSVGGICSQARELGREML